MRTKSFSLLLGLALPLAWSHASAQTQYFVVPQAYEFVEANSTNNYPLGAHETRTQMVYNGALLGFRVGAMTEVAFRRDGANSSTFNQKSIPIKVEISISPNTDRTASLVFAANRGPNPVIIFNANLNLPQSPPPPTPPAPFDVIIPFNAPWIYTGGNICIEIENTAPKPNDSWHLDCYFNREGGRGASTSFGASCASQAPNPPSNPVLGITTSQLLIGKTAMINVNSYRNNMPCLLFLGASKTSWGGTPLPFDLTPMGATGCQVLVDAAIAMAAMSDPTLATAPARFGLRVPDDLSLVNLPIPIQGFVADPADNPLGLLSTHGADISFATSTLLWEGAQILFGTTLIAPAGNTAAGNQGAVTRFGGNLQ